MFHLKRPNRIEASLDLIVLQGNIIMSALDDLKASVTTLVTDIGTYRDSVNQAIADAVAKAQSGEEVDLTALKATVDAADATLKASATATTTAATAAST